MEKTPTKIVLILEYDGTNYIGFQAQANKLRRPTIQSELENAIFRLTGEELRVVAASRTDTGVHAKGQVVSFRTHSSLPPWKFLRGLNHYMPEDIAVKSAHRMDDSFNVRNDAVSREYSYFILNRKTRLALNRHFAYQVAESLDVPLMDVAAGMLIGEHDFASFTGSLGSRLKTVKIVSHSGIEHKNDTVIFNMTANSFLPHQIRNTVGALLQVGSGKMNIDSFYDMIKSKEPGSAGPKVPAYGLFLIRVNYSRPFGEEN